jgi:anti-sigma B factor antagonist/stage II sporulation protein AA (anti-sigma F factor antagonist)
MAEVQIVKTEKRLDIAHASALEQALEAALSVEQADITVDMADTVYISSVALRALLKAQKKVNAQGRNMVLVNVSSSVMEVFDVTGFSGILNFEE